MFIHLRGPHTRENGVSNVPLHRKIIYFAWFSGTVRYTSTDTGGRFLLKTRKLRMVVDVSTTLYIYAAHIDVKMVYQMSRCIEKYCILCVSWGACGNECTEHGSHFYPRNVRHTLFSMSAIVCTCGRKNIPHMTCTQGSPDMDLYAGCSLPSLDAR